MFHYTDALGAVIGDMSRIVPRLSHIASDRIVVSFARVRRRTHVRT
ncbi:MAG: hypothetical protein HY815_26900 [Candidatus Riflebacteria bacterium]|nr:hypothetical protein [Candidatus Riflebacteria bacterium]